MPLKGQCGQWSAVAQLDDLSYVAVPITCRAWTCHNCAKRLKRRLIARLRTSTPNQFITLTTSRRTASTPRQAFDIANKAFSLLIKRWRRHRPGAKLEYFMVWEKTKAGWPHIHALLDAPPVSKHWLSHTWNELTRSYIVDRQELAASEHAIAYVSKYLTKDPQVPQGFKRWRRSAGMFKASPPPASAKLPRLSAWRLTHRSDLAMAATFLLHNLYVTRDETGIYHARDDPDLFQKQLAANVLSNLYANLSERDRETVADWPFYDSRHSARPY